MEIDSAVTFHFHPNLFQVDSTGMTLQPSHTNDAIAMGTAERHMLEFQLKYPGQLMFYPHQDAITENGWIGVCKFISVI